MEDGLWENMRILGKIEDLPPLFRFFQSLANHWRARLLGRVARRLIIMTRDMGPRDGGAGDRKKKENSAKNRKKK